VPHKCVLTIVISCCHTVGVFTVQGLKEFVVSEEQVLFQASSALSQCIKTVTSNGAPFIGSSAAVECHRLLLIASMISFMCYLSDVMVIVMSYVAGLRL